MKNNMVIELHDLAEYFGYGELWPIKRFIKEVKKAKLNHTAGAGWPVILVNDKNLLVQDNCVIWIDDNSNIKYSVKSIYDGEIVTQDLDFYQQNTDNHIFAVIWLERLFDIE